jgi:hypothetical protein
VPEPGCGRLAQVPAEGQAGSRQAARTARFGESWRDGAAIGFGAPTAPVSGQADAVRPLLPRMLPRREIGVSRSGKNAAKLLIYLAPRAGFEPATIRLTAEWPAAEFGMPSKRNMRSRAIGALMADTGSDGRISAGQSHRRHHHQRQYRRLDRHRGLALLFEHVPPGVNCGHVAVCVI